MAYFLKLKTIFFKFFIGFCLSFNCMSFANSNLVNDTLDSKSQKTPFEVFIRGGIFNYRLNNFFLLASPVYSGFNGSYLRNGYFTELGIGKKVYFSISTLFFNQIFFFSNNPKEAYKKNKPNNGKAVSLAGLTYSIYYKVPNSFNEKTRLFLGLKYSTLGFKDSREDSLYFQPMGYVSYIEFRKGFFSSFEASVSTQFYILKNLKGFIDYSLLYTKGVESNYRSPNGIFYNQDNKLKLNEYKALTLWNFKLGLLFNINLK
jgi:hypothetical protein